jgi:hypothetical protein
VLIINGSRLFLWHVNDGRRVVDLADVLNRAKVGNIMNGHVLKINGSRWFLWHVHDGKRIVDLDNVLHRTNNGNSSWNKHVLIFI